MEVVEITNLHESDDGIWVCDVRKQSGITLHNIPIASIPGLSIVPFDDSSMPGLYINQNMQFVIPLSIMHSSPKLSHGESAFEIGSGSFYFGKKVMRGIIGALNFTIDAIGGVFQFAFNKLSMTFGSGYLKLSKDLKFHIFNSANLAASIEIDPNSGTIDIKNALSPIVSEIKMNKSGTELKVGSAGTKIKFTAQGITVNTVTGKAVESPMAKLLTGQTVICPLLGSMQTFGNPGLVN